RMQLAVGIRYPILQIIGFQNSGKTTLVEKIVQKGCRQGLKVATIKHHGHPTKLETIHSNKDSARHRQAGAVLTTVEGGGHIHLEAFKKEGWTLDELLKLYTLFDYDCLIIEGYKQADYPK